jgi:hypothetical protein
MSTAAPSRPDCLNTITSQLAKGWENPLGLQGTVNLFAQHDSSGGWAATVAVHTGTMSEWRLQTSPEQADANLHMPIEVLQLLTDSIHTLDYRDPTVMSRTTVKGDMRLINHVAKVLLAPGSDAKERLDWATQRDAQAYQATDLERVHQPSELAILGRIAEGLPFVATGLSPPGAHGVWTLERLRERYGDVLLRVRSADWQETVGQFVDRVQAHIRGDVTGPLVEGFTKAYTEGSTLPEAMRADFMPHRFTLDDYIDPQIWLGAVPVDVPASSLHRDPLDGFLFQVMGRKKLVLYSPDQAPLLYPMKAWNNYQPCWVAPENPRLDVFPDFARARPLEVVLHPGELLIQPAGWFHAVYCLDSPTFSVSYFLRH